MPVPTLIFDEVDAGVSGRAAQRVAEKLASVAKSKQVLCVTHLPQIAAMADCHLRVSKSERAGRTYTGRRAAGAAGAGAGAGPAHRRRGNYRDDDLQRVGDAAQVSVGTAPVDKRLEIC